MSDLSPSLGGPSTAPGTCSPRIETIGTSPSSNDNEESSLLVRLIGGLQKHGTEQTVQALLEGLTKAEMALHIVDIFELAYQNREMLGSVVHHIWEKYVLPEELWVYYDGGETKFKKHIAYDSFISKTVKFAGENELRKMSLASRLEEKWGEGWEKEFVLNTDHQSPSAFSQHYLGEMKKLAWGGISLSDAAVLLKHAVKRRISHRPRGVRKQQTILVSDIRKVSAALNEVARLNNIRPGECCASDVISFLDSGGIAPGSLVEGETADSPPTGNAPPAPMLTTRPEPSQITCPAPALSVRQYEKSVAGTFLPPGTISDPEPLEHQTEVTVVTQQAGSPIVIPEDNGLSASRPLMFLEEILQSSRSSTRSVIQQSHTPTGVHPASPHPSSPSRPQVSPTPIPSTTIPLPLQHQGPQNEASTDDRGHSTSHRESLPGLGHPLHFVSRQLQQYDITAAHAESPHPPSPTTPQASPSRTTPQASPTPIPSTTTPVPLQHQGPQNEVSTDDRGHFTSHHESSPGLGHPLHQVSRDLQHHHISTHDSESPHLSPTPQGSQNPIPSITTPLQSHHEVSTNDGEHSTSNGESPLQPASKRRRINQNIPIDYFKLPDRWASHTPVCRGLLEKGYYTSSDVPQYGSNGFHPVIQEELNAYLSKVKKPESRGRVDNCVHSLVQQALAQNPILYLTALAAMGTENHRLISLPVRLIRFPGSGPPIFMDPGFPFEKFTDLLGGVGEVPATSLFYSLDGARLKIATNITTKEDVGALWDKCEGNLAVAGSQLSEEDLSVVELSGGEFIAMPPQLIWCCESQDNTQAPVTASSTPSGRPITLIEVRYISITPEGELDFDYWPEGSYDKISRFNRDLLTPGVNGWGGEAAQEETKFKAAIEMRGVWAIGDALLGLTSWDSARVQLELHDLFDAPPGYCFNPKFVDFIQDQLDNKLEDMAETYHLVHTRLFPPQLTY